MNVTNKTDDQAQVKICLYRPEDKVDWIPVGAGVFVVTMNQTVPWTAPSGERLPQYHVKAFHPQLIDAELCNGVFGVDDEIVIKGGGGTYTISKA
jgi:hypothetical protein